MKKLSRYIFLLCCCHVLLLICETRELKADNWPQFRGPRASGLNSKKATPTRWDVETGHNIRWQKKILGLAHSAPVIWEDRIYVTTAVGPGEAELKIGLYGDIAAAEDQGLHQWRLMAFDVKNGDLIFDKLGHEGIPRSAHCNSTPATNGEFIVTYFGSEGLFCFDMAGNPVWHKDLGPMDAGYFKVPTAQWGFADSPIIHEER